MKTINTIVSINTEALKSIKDVKVPSNPQEFTEQLTSVTSKAVDNAKTLVLAAQEDQIELLKKVQAPEAFVKQVETYFSQVNAFFHVK